MQHADHSVSRIGVHGPKRQLGGILNKLLIPASPTTPVTPSDPYLMQLSSLSPYIPPRKPVPALPESPTCPGLVTGWNIKPSNDSNQFEKAGASKEPSDADSTRSARSSALPVRGSGLRYSVEYGRHVLVGNPVPRSLPLPKTTVTEEAEEVGEEEEEERGGGKTDFLSLPRSEPKSPQDNISPIHRFLHPFRAELPGSVPNRESFLSLHSTVSGPLPLYYQVESALPSPSPLRNSMVPPRSPLMRSLSQRSYASSRSRSIRKVGLPKGNRVISRSSSRSSARSVYSTYSIYSGSSSQRSTMMSPFDFTQFPPPPPPAMPSLTEEILKANGKRRKKKQRPGRILLPEHMFAKQERILRSKSTLNYVLQQQETMMEAIDDAYLSQGTPKSGNLTGRSTEDSDIGDALQPRRQKTKRKVLTIYPVPSPRMRYPVRIKSGKRTPASPTTPFRIMSVKRAPSMGRSKLMSPAPAMLNVDTYKYRDALSVDPECFQPLNIISYPTTPKRTPSVVKRGKSRKRSMKRVDTRASTLSRASFQSLNSAAMPESATLPRMPVGTLTPSIPEFELVSRPVNTIRISQKRPLMMSNLERNQVAEISGAPNSNTQHQFSVEGFRRALAEDKHQQKVYQAYSPSLKSGVDTPSPLNVSPHSSRALSLTPSSGQRERSSSSFLAPPATSMSPMSSASAYRNTKESKKLPPLPPLQPSHPAPPSPSLSARSSFIDEYFDPSQAAFALSATDIDEELSQPRRPSMRGSAPNAQAATSPSPAFLNRMPSSSTVVYTGPSEERSSRSHISNGAGRRRRSRSRSRTRAVGGASTRADTYSLIPPVPRLPPLPVLQRPGSVSPTGSTMNQEYMLSSYSRSPSSPSHMGTSQNPQNHSVLHFRPRSKSANICRPENPQPSKKIPEVFRSTRSSSYTAVAQEARAGGPGLISTSGYPQSVTVKHGFGSTAWKKIFGGH